MKANRRIDTDELTDDQLRLRAFQVLEKELGPDGAARFLRMAEKGNYGTGDYTADRHLWLEGITVEQIARDIERLRRKSA